MAMPANRNAVTMLTGEQRSGPDQSGGNFAGAGGD
jgi:hypothetical protein